MKLQSSDGDYAQDNNEISKLSPTDDEREGMSWWNALTENRRAYWFRAADTDVPAKAWAEYKRRWHFRR